MTVRGGLFQDLISRGMSGKCSSPVCLSVWLVGACYGLSVRGLQLVLVVSHLVVKIMIPIPIQVVILIQTSQDVLHPVREM